MRFLTTNPWIESVRAAYHKSPAYRALHGGAPVAGTVGAALPQEAGEDHAEGPPAEELALGIPLDDLERDFGEQEEP